MAKSLKTGTAAVLFGSLLLLSPAATAREYGLDEAVFEELNFARTNPQAYAGMIGEEYRRVGVRSPDPQAYGEAMDFLARQKPLSPLAPNAALADAASSFVSVQGSEGGFGHVASDGASLGERLRRHGTFAMVMAEDISYGYVTAREVVTQLIVDPGVPDRGHRANIFDPALRQAGIACGPHRYYRAMCVVDFASAPPRR
jgi:hypothetical protein